ncbi:alpha/beta fold hydrolase [Streptomyces sp. 769]|uniref:thioesterase II family protein n=1 Tax=Streptomyces sp. 769 TaxID=1262452 RepID=UPI00058216E8|nr:alpha/beta fold hydrolase [Streptomyces sp. 769]AJC62131.1 thioesterase [Streptomyces sp. 769]
MSADLRSDAARLIHRHRSGARSRARLVCFPHAGSPQGFFSSWPRSLPDQLELLSVRYPGAAADHGGRAGTLTGLAGLVADEVAALPPKPTYLFGHSMGALVAYETARRLQSGRDNSPVVAPARLFVSGCDAPTVPREDPDVTDDAGLIDELRRLGGTGADLLDDPVMREVWLPGVRHHFRLLASYRFLAGPALQCPVTALVGREDTEASLDGVGRWRELTEASFDLRGFPGDHFYLVPHREQLLDELRRRVAVHGSEAAWQLAP